ncbi:nitrilase-related carbon-nitrogen hydrolase [Azospirillum sp.]|uniref:nitrilase-related carbon-nitrogen hydrolase n=1 Tax=Azospirillum sp. TaxID=34012 RepID=UPI002606C818|nr:nitrilase-related carbon-nitrogen hydrolase [Azospirillum sp.]
MTDRLSIALAQMNPTVGAVTANRDRIRAARAEAAARGADLLVCPELALSGGPPQDLLRTSAFLTQVDQALRDLAADTADGGPALLVGAPWREQGRLTNAALLLDQGAIAAVRLRVSTPDHDGLDESRLFTAGPLPGPVNLRGVRLGLLIGQDLRNPEVSETLSESGAEILVALNAGPFAIDGADERLQAAIARVIESSLPLLHVNLVGGQDAWVFDGASFALEADGRLAAHAPSFTEHLLLIRWERGADNGWFCHEAETLPPLDGLAAVYGALVLGLRDHVNKGHAPGALVDLAGDAASALVAAIAVDALGADRVHAVTTPAPDSAPEELADAAEIAALLGCRLDTLPIQPIARAFDSLLAPVFSGRDAKDAKDATDTLHARTRGVTLVALAETVGAVALSTLTKTDRMIGGPALVKGLFGGYAVLADAPHSMALALARWRNAHSPTDGRGPAGRVVPERVLARSDAKAATPGVNDRDRLPPTDALDALLDHLTGEKPSADADMVNRVWRLTQATEATRRQSPPGPRITGRTTGHDPRFPLQNGVTAIP